MENNIDKAYDNIIKLSDRISNGENVDDVEILSLHKQINDVVSDPENAKILDEIDNVEIPENTEGFEPEEAAGMYDSDLGLFQHIPDSAFDPDGNIELLGDDKVSMVDENITPEKLEKVLGSSNAIFGQANDMAKLIALVKRRLNGETFNPYGEMPQSYKTIIDSQLIQQGQPCTKHNRATASNMVLNELVEEYKKNNTKIMDLDNLMYEINTEIRNSNNEMSKEASKLFLDVIKDRKDSLDGAIGRAKKAGNDELVKKFIKVRSMLDESFNLEGLAEFCKTVKIKKFDVEKPSRYYTYFNSKYENHKNNISNIGDCSKILDRHLDDKYSINDIIKLTVAFCKYCQNMSPDNLEEHTFMYYFIRNIIMLDRFNPRGSIKETMDNKSRKFYDKYIENLERCIDNINNRQTQ